MIEVATDGKVFGVNTQGALFQRWTEQSSFNKTFYEQNDFFF